MEDISKLKVVWVAPRLSIDHRLYDSTVVEDLPIVYAYRR